jgi:hemolysin III
VTSREHAHSMIATAPSAAHPKPLLRGVSHEIAAGIALFAWLVLAALAPSGPARAAANVYGLSLVTLFAVSAVYHRPTWRPRARLVMRRLDHAAIFVLIAGTYTPMCLLLPSGTGRTLLAVAWGGAALGVIQSVFWVKAPKPLVAAAYVVLGWVVVPVMPTLAATLGAGGITLLATGGGLYTLGAVVYAMRRPDPFPRVFGYHEIFHALVIAAAACHFALVAGAIRHL